jgi:hypothetical protein
VSVPPTAELRVARPWSAVETMARSEALLPRGTPTAGITPVAAAVSGERAATERIDERGGRGSLARRYRVGVILRKNKMRKVVAGGLL